MATLGQKVKELRIKKGLSMEELTDLMGYSAKSSIHKIECDKIDLPLSKLKKLASILNVDPLYFLGLEDEKKKNEKIKIEIEKGLKLDIIKIILKLDDEKLKDIKKMLDIMIK